VIAPAWIAAVGIFLDSAILVGRRLGGFPGSLGQLRINVAALLVAGTLTLVVHRAVYARLRAADERRRAGGRKHVIHMPEHIEEHRRHRRGARVG
jgi:hypothetical protein